MKVNQISSPANELLKQIRGLHQRSLRDKQGLFLIEGQRILAEAMGKGIVLRHIVISQSYLDKAPDELSSMNVAEISVVDDREFKNLVTTVNPCGAVAVAEMPKQRSEKIFSGPTPLIVVADAIQDPGNLGTLMRTAYAAQASGMILSKGCVDAYNPKVVRSAAGALFDLAMMSDIEADQIIALLQDKHVPLATCDAGAKTHYFDYDMKGPLALVFGNEGQGLTASFRNCRADSLAIPMNPQAESLNVGISAGIILFEALRQRSMIDRRDNG